MFSLQYTVVGFEVHACSMKKDAKVCLGLGNVDADTAATGFQLKEGAKIPYTFDVHWKVL